MTTYLRHHWRPLLLLSVVLLGVAAMTIYKVIAIPSESWAFIFIVLFVEIAAGVAVFAQSLLRQVATDQADKAFTFSLWFRAAVAVVGVVVFIEAGDLSLNPFSFEAGFISWTGFLTYEIANGLMLLIEYMFSHLLSADSQSTKKELDDLKTKHEKTAGELGNALYDLQAANTALDYIRKYLDNPDEDMGFEEGTVTEDQAVILRNLETHLVLSQATEERWSAMVDVVDNIRVQLEDPKDGEVWDVFAMKNFEEVLDPESYQSLESIIEMVGNNGLQLEVDAKLKRKLRGKHMTVSRNQRGFLCKSCDTWNEQNQSKAPVCSNCGTLNPKKK